MISGRDERLPPGDTATQWRDIGARSPRQLRRSLRHPLLFAGTLLSPIFEIVSGLGSERSWFPSHLGSWFAGRNGPGTMIT